MPREKGNIGMGWFGASESLTTGHLLLRIEFASTGSVMFTLDRGSTGRTWYQGWAQLASNDGGDSLEDGVHRVVNGGLDVVRGIVPSLDPIQLHVELDQSSGKVEVACSGSVRFLESEWESYKRKALKNGS